MTATSEGWAYASRPANLQRQQAPMSKPRETALQRLLKADEVADALGVRVSTVYEWVRMGYIPHIRLGTGQKKPCIRFELDEIKRWLADRKTQGRTSRVPAL